MIAKSFVTLMFGLAALAGAASAAERVERMSVHITEGDGAGDVLIGHLTFDADGLPDDLSGGFSVNPSDNGLKVDFPLASDIRVDETSDFDFGDFPVATFDGDGALVEFEFFAATENFEVEVFEDLTFSYFVEASDGISLQGSGFIRGGTEAVPVPAAAFLFAPMLALMTRKRWKRARGKCLLGNLCS